MELIVDTFNVLHAWTDGPAEEGAREVVALARAIAASEFGSWSVTLVCDGAPPPGLGESLRYTAHGCAILYAGGGRDADSLIERLVDRSTTPRRLTVVSTDRRVQRSGRRRGGRAMASESFVRRLATGTAPRAGEAPGDAERSADDLDEWLRTFGVEQDRAPGGEAGPDPAPATEDPLAREAMRAWPGRVRADELDMERWLDDSDAPPGRPGGRKR